MNRKPMATAVIALALAAGCGGGPPTPNPPKPPEPTMSPTETPESPPSRPSAPDPDSEIVREILAVTAVAKRYLNAITTRNEAEATQLTCRKNDSGLLWISAVGRPITLLGVTTISIDSALATVKIQVEGKPASPLTFRKAGGAWCVG